MQKFGLIVLLATTSATLSGCAPLIIGGAGVAIVDEILEEENGDDGLI